MGRHATVAADKSRKEGTQEVPTTVLDPPQVGGVKAASEISKQRQTQNVGIVARRAPRRASADSKKSRVGSGRTKQGNRQRSYYTEGSGGSGKVGKWLAFVMRHEANSMKKTTPTLDEVWYVDFGASNHMTSHDEWFSYLEPRRGCEDLSMITSLRR